MDGRGNVAAEEDAFGVWHPDPPRARRKAAPGCRDAWACEQKLAGVPGFHHAAQIHHDDALAEVFDDREVVGIKR